MNAQPSTEYMAFMMNVKEDIRLNFGEPFATISIGFQ